MHRDDSAAKRGKGNKGGQLGPRQTPPLGQTQVNQPTKPSTMEQQEQQKQRERLEQLEEPPELEGQEEHTSVPEE